jgi:hypothetical protein
MHATRSSSLLIYRGQYVLGCIECTVLPLRASFVQGTYEATLWAGVLNAARHARSGRETQGHDVFLTAVGGGVFNNPADWIDAAIVRAVTLVREAGATLNVHICHHKRIDEARKRRVNLALETKFPKS